MYFTHKKLIKPSEQRCSDPWYSRARPGVMAALQPDPTECSRAQTHRQILAPCTVHCWLWQEKGKEGQSPWTDSCKGVSVGSRAWLHTWFLCSQRIATLHPICFSYFYHFHATSLRHKPTCEAMENHMSEDVFSNSTHIHSPTQSSTALWAHLQSHS